jgi:hypothetical protein
MGEALSQLFRRAYTLGGVSLASQLALKTGITSFGAATTPDTPEIVANVERKLAELAEGLKVAPSVKPRGTGGKLARYYEFAKEQGGLPLVIRLAARTNITSVSAASLPDTPENLNLVRTALEELLPGKNVPTY